MAKPTMNTSLPLPRPRFLAVLLWFIVAKSLWAAPPNVVMILSDDQAWGDYGFMGHREVQTPHLDRMARESLTFRRGYVPSSLCCPSLASIITGQYPSSHRVVSNDPPGGKESFEEGRARMNAFMDASPTVPKLLVERGYMALQTGKWWQGNYIHGGFTHGMTMGTRHGDKGLDIGRKTMEPIFDFIRSATEQQKPFLVWYAPMMPHEPHTPPERLLNKYLSKTPSVHVARYWAMVEWFDETCGALLQYLDDHHLSENTLVVYVTDNGYIPHEDRPGYGPKSKNSPYDGGLRTPIMVRWKGTVAPRMEEETAVSSLDLAPTILRACGQQVPPQMQGLNLLDEQALKARPAIHGECYTSKMVELDNPVSSLRWRWVIEGFQKLILSQAPHEKRGPELYDLREDPNEQHNLARTRPEEVERLKRIADARWNP